MDEITCGAQFNISPSGEPILFVPDAFSMSQKDYLVFLNDDGCTAVEKLGLKIFPIIF